MKSHALVLALVIILPSIFLSLPGISPAERSITNTAEAAGVHPRLFFSSVDISRLRTQAQGSHREIWEPILEFANDNIDTSPPSSISCPDLEFFRWHGNKMLAFAFAYVISGETRHFELTRRHLLGYTQWEFWGDESGCGDRDLGFHHMLLGNAVAYDWLYSDLSLEDRETIGAHLAQRTQESYEASSSDRYQWRNWWRRSYAQNHHWICNSALGIAALVLDGEDPRAQSWLDQAVDHLTRDKSLAEGIADGSWHESIPYQSYGLTMSLPFLHNLKRLKGIDILPHTYLRNYVDWRIYNSLPNTDRFAFSFGDFEWSWGSAYQPQNILRFAAREYQDGYAQWIADHLVANEGRHANIWNSPWYVFEFLYHDASIVPTSPDTLPLNRTFPDLEGVIWRTGWGPEDLTFALKTGPYGGRHIFQQFINGGYPFDHPGLDQLNNGHDHEDTNTFYLYRGKVDLASETVRYGGDETSYHNTLLIDGHGQYEDPNEFKGYSYWDEDPDLFRGADGKLEVVYETRDFNFLIADGTNRYRLTDPETGKPGEYLVDEFKRYVLFVRPDYFILLDNLRSDSTHRYEWISHFNASVSIEGDWIKGSADAEQVLGVKILAPQPFSSTSGDDGKPFIRLRPASDVSSTRFVTVLYPTSHGDWSDKPSIVLLGEDDQVVGLQVEQAGNLEDHLIKVGPGLDVQVGEYSFDGQVASVSKNADGELARILFTKGVYLEDRNGDRTLLNSSDPDIVVEVDFTGDGLTIFGENLESFSVFAPDVDVNQVWVNDRQVPATRDGDFVVIGQNLLSTFVDVPHDHWAHDYIEVLYQEGYVAGCREDPLLYCPEDILTRSESAVFVDRGIHGAAYMPEEPGVQIFADVLLVEWYAKWVSSLWDDGFTSGCGTDPLVYCPMQEHTRAEGTVFYLRMMHGADYTPPPGAGYFSDVDPGMWYAKWVDAAYEAGIAEPCAVEPELRFCPEDPLTRAVAAYMMVNSKGLNVP